MDSHKSKKHRRRPSILTALTDISARPSEEVQSAPPATDSPKLLRPPLSIKTGARRPTSAMFGSLRSSTKSSSENSEAATEPSSAASIELPPQLSFGSLPPESPSNGPTVMLHGEVQTSAGMFRKKKEYLVLTDLFLTRYKSQSKAAEVYSVISPPASKTGNSKHGQMPSHGSSGDFYTSSDPSEDRAGKLLLSQVVAVHVLNDGKPYFALEICSLDEDSEQASSLTLQFTNPAERRIWLDTFREAVVVARKRDEKSMSSFNLENAARAVEREQDYDPANCAIFKIVQRHVTGRSGRSSSDDLSKVASVVCFLAIGVHKVHLLPLAKSIGRASSPSLPTLQSATTSFGILTLAAISVSDLDDSFDVTFRQPLQRQRTLRLSSCLSFDIIARLYHSENFLRPESTHRFFQFDVPAELESTLPTSVVAEAEDYNSLQRTLIAYCVAYGVNPGSIRYSVNHECEDAPRFELLSPADPWGHSYGTLELLAIMRTLRYNESFGSISFRGVSLDSLNGLHDNYGREYVCTRTKHGTMIRLSPEQLANACLLVQEVRALAATSKRLRRLDFTNCVNSSVDLLDKPFEDPALLGDSRGSGIVEALFPLCRHQTTNVDWICLNGIVLSDVDLDYLVGAAIDRACHFRAIELNSCGLSDRTLGLVLDSLRAHDNTLEAIDIAGNAARIEPLTFDNQISVFGFLRKLDLSNVSRTSGPEPLLRSDTLAVWRLSEVSLSGTTLNRASVDALATYLAHPKSDSLHQLFVDNTNLTGADIATLLHSMVRRPGEVRQMHLDVSQNDVNKGVEQLTSAISSGMTPIQLSMRAIEYRDELPFRKLLSAFAVNKSTQILDISQTALPADASEECCRSLSQLLSGNDTLLELNLSGEESRLAVSKFGAGINEALRGLKSNTNLRTLHVERQKLGLQGADTLADVLRHNSSIQELFCGYNDIPLTGLTELVNALINNTTVIYLPTMEDGRAAAFKSAERAMMQMGSIQPAPPPPPPPSAPRSSPHSSSTSTLKKGISAVKRTAQRTTSQHAPSFPALQTSGSRVGSPNSRSSPSAAPRLSLSSARRLSTDLLAGPPQVSFTIQDVHTTQRLLTEQWDRQCYRLAQYLERNWCLRNNIPVPMEVEDEKFERPESAGSLARMLEQVKVDTTPRVERDIYFDTNNSQGSDGAHGKQIDKSLLSFKQFILDAVPASPGTEAELAKQLRRSEALHDALVEPKTPTQQAFNL